MRGWIVIQVGLLSLISSLSFALVNSSSEIPYYGDQFYQDLASGVSNQDLETSLKQVLRSFHVAGAQGNDQLVASCNGKSNCYAHVAVGYTKARQYLLGGFYLVAENGNNYGLRDVYCQKVYSSDAFGSKKPGPGLIPSDRIVNTEHTWPQSKFSRKFSKDIQKSDMHHLFPTDSKVNGIRGNYEFGEVTQDTQTLSCPGPRFGNSASGARNIFEPPQVHKGHVARALFYFSVRYDLPISAAQEAVLRKWNRENPVDDEERARNEQIFKWQGDRNPFIDYPELADRISDF